MDNVGGSFDETGVMVASTRLIARSDRAAVVLYSLTAYTGGLVAEIRVHWRGPMSSADVARILCDDTDGGLRLGFGYRASASIELVAPGYGRPDGPTDPHWRVGAAGTNSEGSASESRYDAAFTLTPYPESGNLILSVRWTDRGIDTVSARTLLPPRIRVQAKSERIWP